MKAFWWVLAVVWAAGAIAMIAPAQERRVTRLTADTSLMKRLETLAENDSLENARCIRGRVVTEDSITFDAAFDAPWLLTQATDTSGTFHWDECPVGTMAWWHSHPWYTVRKWAAERNLSADAYCNLSPTDQIGFRYPFAIISIRRGLSCFFWQKPDGTYARIPFERDST